MRNWEPREILAWSAAADNYEPIPRNWAHGTAAFYWAADAPSERAHAADTVELRDIVGIRDAHRATYLIDNGRTVRPMYVAYFMPQSGFSAPRNVGLHDFPVNIGADGAPIMRADGRGPVDFSNWGVGPLRAFHVKVSTP